MQILRLCLFAWMAFVFTGEAASGKPVVAHRLDLSGDWQMQSSVLETNRGQSLSRAGYEPQSWHAVNVPTTVLNALVKNGVYADPRMGLNAYLIPDASEEFNAKYDLAKYSHLPDRRNPWRDPYWFRKAFSLPPQALGKRIWLHFDAINYRAEVWLNGVKVADKSRMAGMFQRFQFDITERVIPGVNVLAVLIYPVDHPGVPQTQLEVLGPDRAYQSELMRDVTEIMSVGYDCMMTVPDRNMGILQQVWIDWKGPVDIRYPFVVTDLPLPETNRATLTVSAELANALPTPIKGVLYGGIDDTELTFEQAVELGPHETRLVALDPKLVLKNPRLWWPLNYGEQHLYTLKLEFATSMGPTHYSVISDAQQVQFGVRKVGYEMHELNGYYGRRVLINGQKIFCRGGYIQPELMFDWDATRMEAEIRYYAQANLNLIYFEDIPNPPDVFLELCDRYGLLFGNCFYSCYWLRPGTPYPDDFSLLERCTVDLVKRYRNHPSLILYMAMNEENTKEEVYEMWRRHILSQDGTRWFIPSAYFPSDRKNMGDWFKKDLPTGMTDIGASYSWAETEQYFRWVREGRNWMFMMESGSASLPPVSSLSRFLPEASERSPAREPLYPLNADWAHHGANQYFKGYDSALRRLHGEPDSVADYCWKGHLVTADQHRSMYEAVNHRMWDIASGFTQWKLNACEPSVQWQVFDWFLKPMVSWHYIKKACEPLHVQLNLEDRTVAIVNTRLSPAPLLDVRARLFDLNAKLLWEKTVKTEIGANVYRDLFPIPEPENATPVYFVKLEMSDAEGRLVSENFYWLRTSGVADYKALQSLPPVKLATSLEMAAQGTSRLARVKVANPTDHIAFFVQLALVNGYAGDEILPVFWSDNYFSLLPGESREITARFDSPIGVSLRPTLEIGGWNVESKFECLSIFKSAKDSVRANESFVVNALIANTFLDGGSVILRVDGKPHDTRRVSARGKQTVSVPFEVKLNEPGSHELSVGNQKIQINVP